MVRTVWLQRRMPLPRDNYVAFFMRCLRCLLPLLTVLAILWVGNLNHAVAQPEIASSSPILGPIERYTLPNGLRVVLNPIPDHATVGVCVTYGVGSRDELEGRTGVAHLFEHLMFQGSRNVAGGEHFRWIAARGGHPDGNATKEVTNYFTEIPSGELELVLWLEADRMFHLALTRETFESQRDVVLEELRQRHANSPFARGQQRLHELVFQRYWPYEHPALGYRNDVEAMEYAWVRQFYQQYYTPNRAVIAIVGGIDVEQVKAWLHKYFSNDGAEAPPQARLPVTSPLPRQTSERLNVLEDHNAKTPGVYFGWRIPGARTVDNRALELASFVLTGSETSRLAEHLVLGEQVAQHVRSSTAGYADTDIFQIFVELNRRSTVDAMQKALEKTLTSLAVVGPTEEELERARLNIKVRWLQRMERAKNRAVDLGQLENEAGDAGQLAADYYAYDSISVARVRSAVARYLVDSKRSIVETYPPGWVRDIGPPIVTASYIVKPGDNLTRIAQWHGTTPEAIAKQNGFGLSRRIVVGQRLLITANPSKIVKPITHTVAKGETLIGIGKKYGVAAADVAKRNGLNPKKPIKPGQILQIPPRPKSTKATEQSSKQPPTSGPGAVKGGTKPDQVKSTPADETKTDATSAKGGTKAAAGAPRTKATATTEKKTDSPAELAKPLRTYVVKPGDSLSVIAARHKVSVAALTRANGISKKKPIRPGQRLVIPASQ